MEPFFDGTREDVGNIVHLEYVNVRQPDQRLATLFYVLGLGLTRDPYMMVGLDNMWINIGRHQMHVPTGPPPAASRHDWARDARLERPQTAPD